MAGSKAEKKQRLFNREFRLRTISSVFIVLIVLGAANYGGLAWTLTASVIALLSLSEYYRLIGKLNGTKISTGVAGVGYIFSVLFLFLAMKESAQAIILAMVLSLCVFAVFIVEIVRRQLTRDTSYAVGNAGGVISGVLYITVPWVCMIMLREYAFGRQILITILACTWSCDVFAYIGGRLFGSMKLCENVSPGKTVQGFVAGIIGSIIANALAMYYFSLPNNPLLLIGIICGTAGQAGDLAESLIKRETGEKDSGHVIPGHGGMLDRFDSILFNGLISYLVLRVILS